MCQVSFILDPDDMRKLHILMENVGKITHSNCSDGKHRWGSESWILAEINYYRKIKEVDIIKMLLND